MLRLILATFTTTAWLICGISAAGRPSHVAHVSVVPEGDSFKASLLVNGEKHELNLKAPESSIITPNFKLHEATNGPRGQFHLKDVTPSPQQLAEIEGKIYVDQNANAVFKFDRENNDIRLHGILNNIHIAHNGTAHVATLSHAGAGGVSDYVNLNRKLTPSASPLRSRRQAVQATPEVHFIVDKDMYAAFDFEKMRVTEYVLIAMRMVNNIYAASADPIIRFKVSSATYMTDATYQPYIENSRSPNGYDLHETLNKYSSYMYTYRNYFAKHDLAPLLVGNKNSWESKDKSGNWVRNLTGVSWLAGGCYEDESTEKSYKTSVVIDHGAKWEGVVALAHELGHGLGAGNDGQGSAGSCDDSSNTLMSYRGGASNTDIFSFSSCSSEAMRNFISSDEGSCVTSDQSDTHWSEPNGYYYPDQVKEINREGKPGSAVPNQEDNSNDIPESSTQSDEDSEVSLDNICKELKGNPLATADWTLDPSVLCSTLKCSWPCPCNDDMCTCSSFENFVPPQFSTCSKDGNQCVNGECITINGLRAPWPESAEETGSVVTLDAQCRGITKNENATADRTIDSNTLCGHLKCTWPCACGNGMCTCSSFAPNNYAPHDNSPCDENGGTCMNGKCVSDAPAPVVLGFDVKSLNETCQELRGTQSTFAKEDAHDNCQVLRCRFPCPHCETCVCFSAYEEFVAPDYAKCGRAGDSRRCLDRECVELWV